MSIRTLVVDDEPAARAAIRELLRGDSLAQLDKRQLPAVVFVTAHDRHAVRAVHAVDYLLKPFTGAQIEPQFQGTARAAAWPSPVITR